MKPRILFVSTFPELSNMAKGISNELEIPLSIFEGGIMKNGHIYAKKMENNFDVIISQGGTAACIKNMVNIPVVSIEISLVDFLNALVKAKGYGDKIGIVSHKNEKLDDLESLKHMLNIDFELFPYSNRDELKKQIEDATAVERMTVVAMGSCIIEISREKQLNSVLITSSRREVKQAIIAAKNICDVGKREKERVEWLKTIIDYSGEGIIALDKDGTIITLNSVAEKIFDLNAYKVIGQQIFNFKQNNILRVIYEDGSYELGKLYKTNHMQIIINRVPIVVDDEQVGTVLTFQEVSKLQKLERKVRAELYTKGLVAKHIFDDIIGQSIAIKNAIDNATRFGRTSTTILIEGETGSGKELFAQSIHNISNRSDGPFVAINCAALPENLLESELFGYEEGAFTGAKKGGKLGLFELADGGTIFLDEIGEISLGLQSRLLRVLQEREVMRIGGDYILNVDIRVIAATNLDLYKMVEEGKFREDLYFRINVLNLKIPPLRERKEDIPLLIRNFIDIMNCEHSINIKDITESGMNLLKEYYWPGNVRELENFVEKMVILADSQIIDEDFIERLLNGHAAHKRTKPAKYQDNQDDIVIKAGQLKDMELQIIDAISKRVKGDKTLLAEKLGISRTTLWKRLKELEEGVEEDTNYLA